MGRLLLVDDDSEALASLRRVISGRADSFHIETAISAERALEIAADFVPDVIIADLSIDSASGVESGFCLVKSLLSLGRSSKIIVLTGHASAENGIRALNLGASHFLEKPADIDHLMALIRDCIRQSELYRSFENKSGGLDSMILCEELVGDSLAIRELREEICFAASNSQAVLLTGETGTGKTLCASLIHRLSARRSAKFVCYAPAYHSADLVNSDLFGHIKGAFTGAVDSRTGLLSEADGGTFFLDEVSELPHDTQIGLLRVMQSREFRPLGSNKDLFSDFRLIAATNHNHADLVGEGRIRADFYHRIAHSIVKVPSLRERKSDLPQLCDSILRSLARKDKVMVFSVGIAALDIIFSYDWPGNVRQLQAVLEGAAFRASYAGRTAIMPADLRLCAADKNARPDSEMTFHERLSSYKEKLVCEAMQKCGDNQVKAARLLGIDRSSLRRILGKE